jgi:low temperature requirement protein LtrA
LITRSGSVAIPAEQAAKAREQIRGAGGIMVGMATATTGERGPRLRAVLREGERVTPLELFFDLVFVLALTQCTALMSNRATWDGIAQGVLVLGVLWWSWVGYAWLTSVVDPEEGAVRIVIFVAMAAFLIAAIAVPEAFDDLGLAFALAYAVVRAAHIALFVLASRDDPALRQSVIGLAGSTAVGVTLLVAASFLDGLEQGALWAVALGLDMAGPYFFGAEGWKLVPGHFAERHGLIVIIALGESIVAVGVGADAHLTAGIDAAAILGIALAAAFWWIYFDVVALVSARRLIRAAEGRDRNELARDSYSYLHFPMVAGIVLVAVALKKTLGHVEDPLDTVPAFALLAGTASYLLGLVAFRYRHIRSINRQRLLMAVVLVALLPLATALPALAILAVVTVMLWALIAYETVGYGEGRARARHEDFAPERPGDREDIAPEAAGEPRRG